MAADRERIKKMQSAVKAAKRASPPSQEPTTDQNAAYEDSMQATMAQPLTHTPAHFVSEGLQLAGEIINRVEGTFAGMVKFERERIQAIARGEMPFGEAINPVPHLKGAGKAAYEGQKNKATYEESLQGLTGVVPPIPGVPGMDRFRTFNPGKILDYASPASMLIPIDIPVRGAVKLTKAGGKALGKGVEKAASKTAFTSARLEDAKEVAGALRQVVDQPYHLKQLGIPKFQDIQSEHLGRLEQIRRMPRHEYTKQIEELVPDPKRVEQVYIVADMSPQARVPRPVEKIIGIQREVRELGKRRERLARKAAAIEAQKAAVEGSTELHDAILAAKGGIRQKELSGVEGAIRKQGERLAEAKAKIPSIEKEKSLAAKELSAIRKDAATKRDIASSAVNKERKRVELIGAKKDAQQALSSIKKQHKKAVAITGKDYVTREEKLLERELTKMDRQAIQTQREIAAIDDKVQRLGENALMIRSIEEQVKSGEYARRLAHFETEMAKLPPNEQKAAQLARKMADEIERDKISGRVLSEEHAYGVQQKTGYRYLPRVPASRESALLALDRAIEEQGTKPWLVRRKEEIQAMPRSPFSAMVRRARGRIARPSFTKQRKVLSSLEDLGEARGIYDLDLPRVLEVSRLSTARAKADRDYLWKSYQYFSELGRVRDVEQAAISSGQWKRFPDYFPGFPKDKMIPAKIYDEVVPMLARSIDPEGIRVATHLAQRATSIYRNWNLFVAPEYFIRNVVGNYFNNYATHGMGLSAIQDYVIAGKYNIKNELGKLSDTEIVPLTNMTEREFFDKLEANRVIGAGQTSEAAGDFVANQFKRPGLKDIFNPTEANPVLRGGHEVQRFMENDARLAAFFYQLRRGKTFEEAARGVFKSLFDYQLGLTKFEREKLRLLFPFYAWSRFNYPLQLEMLSQYPHRYIDMARFGRAVEMAQGGPEPNEAYFPEWMRDTVHVRIHYDEGTQTWYVLSGKNWVPAADLEVALNPQKWGKELLNQITPGIKLPFEYLTNVDTYRSTPNKIRKIEEYPGQTENILGVDVPKRTAGLLLRQARIARMAQNVREELTREQPGQKGTPAKNRKRSAAMRTLIGRAQPIRREDYKKRFLKQWDRDMAELEKNLRSAIRAGDKANEKRLREEKQKLIEARKRALAGGE